MDPHSLKRDERINSKVEVEAEVLGNHLNGVKNTNCGANQTKAIWLDTMIDRFSMRKKSDRRVVFFLTGRKPKLDEDYEDEWMTKLYNNCNCKYYFPFN